MITTLALCAAAFVAGLIDSVVGGGGLVQLPALFIAFPQAQAALLLGTNRTSSIFGTTTAMLRYARETAVPWRTMLPTAAVAAATSLLGAWTVTHVSNVAFKPLVLVILVLVTVYTLRNKNLGQIHAPRLSNGRQRLAGALIGALLGFYDGFMGPGTGSFLLFAFVGILGFSFLAASASAKVINVATNAASLAYFRIRPGVVAARPVYGWMQCAWLDRRHAAGVALRQRVRAQAFSDRGSARHRALRIRHCANTVGLCPRSPTSSLNSSPSPSPSPIAISDTEMETETNLEKR